MGGPAKTNIPTVFTIRLFDVPGRPFAPAGMGGEPRIQNGRLSPNRSKAGWLDASANYMHRKLSRGAYHFQKAGKKSGGGALLAVRGLTGTRAASKKSFRTLAGRIAGRFSRFHGGRRFPGRARLRPLPANRESERGPTQTWAGRIRAFVLGRPPGNPCPFHGAHAGVPRSKRLCPVPA